jgi:hypothetical protein
MSDYGNIVKTEKSHHPTETGYSGAFHSMDRSDKGKIWQPLKDQPIALCNRLK